MEVGMLDRLVELFCAMDDFCTAFFAQWALLLLSAGKTWERGPECGLSESEIMTIVVLYHGSRCRYFKNFYNGVVLTLLKQAFPGLPQPTHRAAQGVRRTDSAWQDRYGMGLRLQAALGVQSPA
jgi:hypothetical protein